MERDGGNDELNNEEDELKPDHIECLGLTGELLRQFERNDPSLTGLTVQYEGWILGAGIMFAQCKFLKRLNIILDSEINWFAELCAGIACNETIEHLLLGFDRCGGVGVNAFQLLAPFLRNNLNLRALEIVGNYDPVPMDTKLEFLASAFEGRKSGKLQKMCITWCTASDKEAAALFESLGGQHNLRFLAFSANEIEMRECEALGSLIENPRTCKVDTLYVGCENMSADCFAILYHACLAKSNTLRELDLSEMNSLSVSSCLPLAMVLSQPLSMLKKLRLSDNDFRDEGISFLGNALALNTTLQHLDLHRSSSISSIGWRAFSNCLQNPHSSLKDLLLWECKY